MNFNYAPGRKAFGGSCISLWLLLQTLFVGAQLLPGETLPTLKSVDIGVSVQLSTGGVFTYAYTVFNTGLNTGEIDDIDLDISKGTNTIELGSEGLTSDESLALEVSQTIFNQKRNVLVPVGLRSPHVGQWISSLSVNLTASWGAVAPLARITPGEAQDGFVVQSRGIPGIRKVTLHPRFEQTPVEEATVEDVTRIRSITDQIKFTALTIGPVSPRSLGPVSLIDDLIGLKHESASLGWIFGPGMEGIVKSLDAKLDAAKVAVGRGQNKAAANQLSAFVNELGALRGKKLNDSAYFLLRVNAEFIISRLGP